MADLLRYQSGQSVSPETPNVLQQTPPAAPIFSAIGQTADRATSLIQQEKQRDFNLWLRGAVNQSYVDARGILNQIETNMPKELVGDKYMQEFETQFKEQIEEYKSNLDPKVRQYIEPEINNAWLNQSIKNRREGKSRQIEFTLNATNTAVQMGINDIINATGNAETILKERGRAQARIESSIRDLGSIANLREDEIKKQIDEQMWQINQAAFDRDKETQPYMAELFIDQGIYTTDEEKKTDLREKLKISKERQDNKASQNLLDATLIALGKGDITPDQAMMVEKELNLADGKQLVFTVRAFREEQDRLAVEYVKYKSWTESPSRYAPKAQAYADQSYADLEAEKNSNLRAAEGDEDKQGNIYARFVADNAKEMNRTKMIPSQIRNQFVNWFNTGTKEQQIEATRLFKSYYDAAPEAWSENNDSEILYYKMLSYISEGQPKTEASPGGIEGAVDRFDRFRTQYSDPALRKKFREFANEKETQDTINAAISDSNLTLRSAVHVNQVITDMVSLGMGDLNPSSMENMVNVALRDLEYSPMGIGITFDTRGNTRNDIYTMGKVLMDDPVLLNTFWLETMEKSGYDVKTTHEEIPAPPPSTQFIGGGLTTGLDLMIPEREKPYYYLEGDSGTPDSFQWHIIQVNPDGTEITLPDGFTFDFNIYTGWNNKRLAEEKTQRNAINAADMARVQKAKTELQDFNILRNDLR